MHPSRAFAWTDEAAMLAFIGEVSWARLFAATPAGLRVVHAPVTVTPDGHLRFHVANANAVRPHMDGASVLAVVEGPHAYLSGSWSTDERSAVPSWNYVAVECEGVAARLDRDGLVALLDDLARILEPQVGGDWTRARMEPARFAAMLNAITGFELRIADIRGTRKLSQNKPAAAVAPVLAGLEANGARDVAAAMRDIRMGDAT